MLLTRYAVRLAPAALLLGAVLFSPAAFGYIRLTFTDSMGTVNEVRADNAGVQFYINSKIGPGLGSTAAGSSVTVVSPNSDPVGAARAAIATWARSAAGVANLKFLPLKATDATHSSQTPDYLSTITFASTDDLSVMGYAPGKSMGAIALTVPLVAAQTGQLPNGLNVHRGDIVDSDILLNSSLAFSTDGSTGYDLQGVLTHEIGHALGLNHTGLLGATMFQFSSISGVAQLNQRYLSADEISFATAGYPMAGASTLGTITGKVIAADGSPVKYSLLTLVDLTGGSSVNALTGTDGTYSAQVLPGTYVIYAEPLSAAGIVQPGNIIGSSGSLDPTGVTGNYQTSMLGLATSPTAVDVGAGKSTTAPDLKVTAGVSQLTLPFMGMGTAGGAGDIRNVTGVNGPRVLASGQSIDIAFLAGGFDGTENILVLGQGITTHPSSLHVDKTVNFSAGPLVRMTIDIAAVKAPILASIFAWKASGSLSMSGVFVIVPPKPSFKSASVVNAASYTGLNGGVEVSPGGIYSIYDIPDAPNLGPIVPVVNGGYDAYGKLPSELAGVIVTFDGVPAPLFFVYGGQINLQVPFEVAGKTSTKVVVTYQGSSSDPITVPVAAAQPAFFTVTALGSDSIVGNQDYTLNGAGVPAAKGSVVTIYGTGLGKLSYDVPTGVGAPGPSAGFTGGNTCVLGGSKSVSVAFTGWSPTAVGLAQWSMVLPQDSPTGKVAVVCTDPGGNSTPPGTIYIK